MIQWFPHAACVLAAWSAQQGSATVPDEMTRLSSRLSAIEEEWAEEPGVATSSSGGLITRVDVGRAPGRTCLRVSLEGAAPLTNVILELGSLRGESLGGIRRQLLCTDAEGRAQLEYRGPLPDGLGARFVARPKLGAAQHSRAVGLPGSGTQATFVPQRGDIVITEIMKDPSFVSDAHGEWFEIQNITTHVINIAGWKISDLGTNSHTISNNVQPLYLSPGQRFVLGIDQNPLTNGGVVVDYKYSNFTLGNAADSILLTARSGYLIDEVDYDDGIFWPDVPGKTLSLHLFAGDVYLNDDPANWCPGKTLIGGGNTDMGTPGQDNDTCP